MPQLDRVKEILLAAGIPAEAQSLDQQHGKAELLSVGLQVDDEYREHVLLIDCLPPDRQTGLAAMLTMTLMFPFRIVDVNLVPEVARLLLLLNRFVPFGHYGIHEDPLSIYYAHRFLATELDSQALTQSVEIISHFTRCHAAIVDQVLDRTIRFDDVIEMLEEQNVKVPSLILPRTTP